MGGLDVCVHSLSLQEHNLRVAHLVRMYCLLSSSGSSCNPGLCLNLLWCLSSLSPPLAYSTLNPQRHSHAQHW